MDALRALVREHIHVGVLIAAAIDATALPFPGRVLLIAAGALAAQGDVKLSVVIAAGALGAIIGDHLWYLAGRWHGERMLGFYCRVVPRTERCVSRARDYLARFGAFTFIVGRFVAGVRVLAAPVASGAGIGYVKFLVSDLAGAVLWSATFTGLGYVLGVKAPALMEWLGLLGQLAIGIGVTVIARSPAPPSGGGSIGASGWSGVGRRRGRFRPMPQRTRNAAATDIDRAANGLRSPGTSRAPATTRSRCW